MGSPYPYYPEPQAQYPTPEQEDADTNARADAALAANPALALPRTSDAFGAGSPPWMRASGGPDQIVPPTAPVPAPAPVAPTSPAQAAPRPGYDRDGFKLPEGVTEDNGFTFGQPAEAKPPETGVLSSFAGGLERGGAALHGQIGRVVSTVLRKTGEWTDQDWLKAGADALDKVTTDVDEGAKKVGTVGDMSIAQAWKTGNFMNLIAEKVGEGLPVGALAVAAGSISPMIPIIYGVVTAGNDEARKPDATAASVLSQATIGGASMGLNLKIAQSFAGKQFVARALAQAGELGVFGAVTPFADQITEALHTGSQGYQAPSAEQVGSSVLGSVAMTPALMGAQRLLHGPQGPSPTVKTEGGTETLPSEGDVDPDAAAAMGQTLAGREVPPGREGGPMPPGTDQPMTFTGPANFNPNPPPPPGSPPPPVNPLRRATPDQTTPADFSRGGVDPDAAAALDAAKPPTGPGAPMTVAQFVDDYQAGKGRDDPAYQQFAANNAQAIEAEFQRRQAQAGTPSAPEVQPPPTGRPEFGTPPTGAAPPPTGRPDFEPSQRPPMPGTDTPPPPPPPRPPPEPPGPPPGGGAPGDFGIGRPTPPPDRQPPPARPGGEQAALPEVEPPSAQGELPLRQPPPGTPPAEAPPTGRGLPLEEQPQLPFKLMDRTGWTVEPDDATPGQFVVKHTGDVLGVGSSPAEALQMAHDRADRAVAQAGRPVVEPRMATTGDVLAKAEAAPAGGESATEAAPSLATEATAPVAEAAATTGSAAPEATTPAAKPPVVVETRRGKLQAAVDQGKARVEPPPLVVPEVKPVGRVLEATPAEVKPAAELVTKKAETAAKVRDAARKREVAQQFKEASEVPASATPIARGEEGGVERASTAEKAATETRATETVGENKESALEQRAKTSTDKVRDVAEPLIADYLKDPGMRTPGEIYDTYGEPTRKGGMPRRFRTFLDYLHDRITQAEKGPSDKAVIADANAQVGQIIEQHRKSGKPLTKVQEGQLWQAASEHIVNARKGVEETLPALRKLRSQIIGELSARSGTDKASTIHSDEDLYRIEKQGDKNANTYGSFDEVGSDRRTKAEASPAVNLETGNRAYESASGGPDHDLHDYLNDIVNSPGVRRIAPHFVSLARILRQAIRPGIEVRGDFDHSGASYSSTTDRIHINPEMPVTTRGILHEGVHAGTVDFLRDVGTRLRNGEVVTPRERQIYQSLDALAREVTRMRANMEDGSRLKSASDYALSSEEGAGGRYRDHEELVTMLMTDPEILGAMAREEASPVLLRELKNLDMMPVAPGRRPSLYDTFKTIIGRIFGLTPDRVSVLDAALRPLTDTLREGTRFRNREIDRRAAEHDPNNPFGLLTAKDYYSPDTVKGKITDRLPGDLPEKLSDLGSRLQSFGNDGFVGAASKSAETARQWFDREARTRKAGAPTSAKRIANEAALISAPTTMIAEWNRNLPEVRDIARARSMQEEARSNTFSRWGDRVKGWVSDLKNAGDGFEHLRNEVSRVEADVIKGDFTHVRPENLAYAQELKGRYDKLPDRQKELFSNLVDYHATTGHDERQAWMEHVVDRAMGGGIDEAVRRDPTLGQVTDNAGNELRSPEERANAIRKEIADIARSKTKLDELSKNPDGSDLAKLMGEHWEPSRDIVKLLATVQSRGWRQGNFTSLQRHGDYLVVHGDKLTGDKYGVHRFERPGEAQLFREDFKKTHPSVDISPIRLIDTTGSKDFLSGRMQTELGKALERAGITGDAAEEIQRSFGGMVLQHGINTMAARYAARRRGIYGASKNGSMNLVRDLAGHASRMGYLAHSAEETRAYNNLDKRVRQIEQPRRPGTQDEIAASQKLLDAAEDRYKKGDVAISRDEIEDLRQQHEWLKKPPEGDAITAEQVKKELEARRLPIDHDDTARRFGDVAKKFTSASFVLHLMRPAHLAVQVADAQSQGLSYLGGAHGFARAGAALTKNIGRFAPPGMRAGGRAMLNAVRGQMKQADWMVSKAYEKRLTDSGMHPSEVKALMTEANHWGLVNQSMEREIQRTAKGGFGFGGSILHVPGNMMDLFAAAEHMTDSVNRMAILTSAYELKKIDNGGKLNDGKVDQNAIDHAINMTNMAMPNYGAWNKPRLASERGPLGPLGAAAMQYKIYGMNMYSGMAVLARDAIKNPEQRAVALKSLAGIFATHALLVGATANMFGVPINVMTGLWDWLEGKPGPHDYENDMRKWMTDNWGPTKSTFLSRGLLGLAGIDLHRSLKITNATDLPGVKTFDRAGVSGMIAQALTGASGDVAEQYADAAHQAMTGNIQKAIIGFAPRVVGDIIKARQMAEQGITDSKGKTILPAGRISTPAVVFQGLGFNPEEISAFRANRASGDEWIHEMSSAKSNAEARFVSSGGKDRSAVQAYNRDRQLNQGILIRPQDLQTALKRARESIARPGSYGLSIPQREQRGVRAVTGFY